MDLVTAIDVHRTALLRLVASLFAGSELGVDGKTTLSRFIRRSVLHILRPAESAARRLIFARARGLVVKLGAARAGPSESISRSGKNQRAHAFSLFDRKKNFGLGMRPRYVKNPPCMTMIGVDDWTPRPTPPQTLAVSLDGSVDAARVLRRMQALKTALEDLPKQAQRLARVLARRTRDRKGPVSPMRPGRPPGHRSRGRDEIDEILRACHQLALWGAVLPPDTS